MKVPAIVIAILLVLSTLAFAAPQPKIPTLAELNAMAARFAPAPMRVDIGALSPEDRQALVKLIEAAKVLNTVFMNQYWAGGAALDDKLRKDRTPLGPARVHYFWLNKGPWSDIDEYKAFIPGVPPRKPLGANFYPENMTKAEFEAWVKTLPEVQQKEATGFFTVIRRGADKKLTIVPFSEAYRGDLERAAGLLREAAALTSNATLRDFLSKRADAFLSNDYYDSDVAWMDLDAPLDVTIGPYETYNDELFGYKAAFEAYISLRDDQETSKLAALSAHLQELEKNLPEEPQYRNPKLGAAAPIRVVNQIFNAGDAAHGVQTAAYNLPNDERVISQKGSKRVMLKNVQEAKFRNVLIPIAGRTLARGTQADVSFAPFFTHILAHELMHGLGPQQITVNGAATTPRKELKELYGAIEEAKADVTGLWALQYMMDHAKEMKLDGIIWNDGAGERQMYTTYLASAFRTLRFGLNDAHGKGMALQFNYIVDHGGFVQRPDGTFAVDFTKIKDAVRDLTHDLLTIEATGDYDGARRLLDSLAVVRPPVQKVLNRLQAVPVDIEPQFVTADELTNPQPQVVKKAAARKSRARRSRARR